MGNYNSVVGKGTINSGDPHISLAIFFNPHLSAGDLILFVSILRVSSGPAEAYKRGVLLQGNSKPIQSLQSYNQVRISRDDNSTR